MIDFNIGTELVDIQLRKRKKFDLIYRAGKGGSVTTPALLYGKKIVFAAMDSNIYCIDLRGNELWRLRIQEPVFESMSLFKDMLIFGSYDSHVYCYDIENVTEIWRFKTNDKIACSPPCVYKDIILIGSGDGNLYCINSCLLYTSPSPRD